MEEEGNNTISTLMVLPKENYKYVHKYYCIVRILK